MQKSVCVVACAAVPARTLQDLIVLLQAARWAVCVVATPNATDFMDVALLADLTGQPVISAYEQEDDFSGLDNCAALVVIPATFNTLRKWAEGITDTFALSLLQTAMGQRIPILAVPRASPELAQEPAFFPSIAYLRGQGVTILYDPIQYPPNNNIPWQVIVEALETCL